MLSKPRERSSPPKFFSPAKFLRDVFQFDATTAVKRFDAAKVEAANVALHSARRLIGEKMTQFLVCLTSTALVVASAAPAAVAASTPTTAAIQANLIRCIALLGRFG